MMRRLPLACPRTSRRSFPGPLSTPPRSLYLHHATHKQFDGQRLHHSHIHAIGCIVPLQGHTWLGFHTIALGQEPPLFKAVDYLPILHQWRLLNSTRPTHPHRVQSGSPLFTCDPTDIDCQKRCPECNSWLRDKHKRRAGWQRRTEYLER